MEFKDRLKKLRKEKQISQQELANAIYVSRSAIAKWENGLGIPNQTSYRSLLDFFGITNEELPLNEEIEAISVSKNKRIHNLSSLIVLLILIVVSVIIFTSVNAFMNGYGFTSKMAAGKNWADNECVQTPEYDFYYGCIEGENDMKIIDHFCVVEKKFIGYYKETKLEEHEKMVYDKNGNIFGYVYSFKGERVYYHIFVSIKTMGGAGVKINLLHEITIKEDTIPVLHNSYFETAFELTEFYSNGNLYVIK